MKIKYFFAVSFTCTALLAAAQDDPTLMTVNGHSVQRSEFEYHYNKNNAGNTADKKSLQEYADMFAIFKMKVEEAQTQGLDTVATFKRELNGYRTQLAEQYLTDTETHNSLLLEAYNRMLEDVNVSHIFFRIPQFANPEDTLLAYNKALQAEKRLKKEAFADVAKSMSDDQNVAQNGGNLDWVTSFGLLYPMENAVYSLPVGKISDPVRSQAGYHILKVNDRRQDPGEVHVAHIVKISDPKNPEIALQNKTLIDSLYQRILAGEDFAELARKYSDDKASAVRGGDMAWFGTGRMILDFEKHAFALTTPNEVSQPFETAFGWHIAKLIEKRPIASFDELKPTIEKRFQRDERATMGQKALVEKLKKQYAAVLHTDALKDYYPLINESAEQALDSLFFTKIAALDKPLLTIANTTFTEKDFNNFLSFSSTTGKTSAKDIINEKADNFLYNKVLEYRNSQLDNEYPEFRNLLREYHDGILLFDVSNREVWDKAQKDTTGLKNYFLANKEKYTWEQAHFRGTVVYCKDKASYNAAKKIIKKEKGINFERILLNKLNNDSVQFVKFQKGLYAAGDNKEIDKQIFNINEGYALQAEFPYAIVVGKNLGFVPETYIDVRVKVSSDYQDFLETEWIKSLRAKYPLIIDQTILKTVKSN
jgi:peptidyl-prolyl cis-trans isomerase SurA